MSRLQARRIVVAGIGTVVVASMVPVLSASVAQATHAGTSRLTISTPSRASAGTCVPVTINATDSFGNPAHDGGDIVVTISEEPNGATQDVDFCTASDFPGGATESTPVAGPTTAGPSLAGRAAYRNADDPLPPPLGTDPTTETYIPGPSVTTNSSGNSTDNNPDRAATAPASGESFADNNANATGRDSARFRYTTDDSTIRFGVVALTAGNIRIEAFRDATSGTTANGTQDTGEVAAQSVAIAVTSGGAPGSVEAANAARTLDARPTVESAPDTSYATAGQPHSFTVTVFNAQGDTLSGVTVRYVVSGANPTSSSSVPGFCGDTNNSGSVTCAYVGNNQGTDIITFYVNQTAGNPPTAGPDSGEPRDTSTAQNLPPATTNQPTSLQLTQPADPTPAGDTRHFAAFVTDAGGRPVEGVQVLFTESGAGSFAPTAGQSVASPAPDASPSPAAGTTFLSGTTDGTGRVVVAVTSSTGDAGQSQTITANLQANAPSCPPATCKTTSHVWAPARTQATAGPTPGPTNSPTPSPSASPTASPTVLPTLSPTASPTASPTVSPTASPTVSPTASPTVSPTASPTVSPTVSPTASPTASPTVSPTASPTVSPTASPTRQPRSVPVVDLIDSIITVTQSARLNVHAEPGEAIEVLAYSRPDTSYAVVRRGTVPESGVLEYLVTPPGNTRLYARYAGDNSTAGDSVVISVRPAISLSASRARGCVASFQGRVIPARNQIIGLYFRNGSGGLTLAGQARVGSDGIYRYSRAFQACGRTITFLTRLGTNMNNVANHSPDRRITFVR